jgi:hypothetical protein
MSTILSAGFDSLRTAESAAHALFAEGFHEDTVDIFCIDPCAPRRLDVAEPPSEPPEPVNPDALWRGAWAATLATAIFAMAGAIVAAAFALGGDRTAESAMGTVLSGTLTGLLLRVVWLYARERRQRAGQGRLRPSVLITVLAEKNQLGQGLQLLRDAGGVEVRRLRSRRNAGQWIGFAPLRPMGPEPGVSQR